MNLRDVQLPSNRKFGSFFASIFLLLAVYFYWQNEVNFTAIFAGLAIVFGIITLIKDDLLLPFNKLWMGIGVLIGSIVSPIVLGFLFFGLFTPLAILMRLFGRDELLLKQTNEKSFWRVRNITELTRDSFKNQF